MRFIFCLLLALLFQSQITSAQITAFSDSIVAEKLSNSALIGNPDTSGTKPATAEATPGYSNGETKSLDNLVEGTGAAAPAQEPVFGQGTTQQ